LYFIASRYGILRYKISLHDMIVLVLGLTIICVIINKLIY
jgi:hypothetical protein